MMDPQRPRETNIAAASHPFGSHASAAFPIIVPGSRPDKNRGRRDPAPVAWSASFRSSSVRPCVKDRKILSKGSRLSTARSTARPLPHPPHRRLIFIGFVPSALQRFSMAIEVKQAICLGDTRPPCQESHDSRFPPDGGIATKPCRTVTASGVHPRSFSAPWVAHLFSRSTRFRCH